MAIWVKTTIDIPTTLFEQAKGLAARKGITFREIVAAALRLFLQNQREAPRRFRLKRHPFRGQGLVEGVEEGNWAEIRWRAYEGRGG